MLECRKCGKTSDKPSPVCPWCGALIANPDAGRLASVGQRLGGYLLDTALTIVITTVLMIMGGAIGAAGGLTEEESLGTALLFWLVGSLILQCYFWSEGTSLGKYLLGLGVYKVDGARASFLTMFVRDTVGKMVSGLAFSLGFLWLLWDPCRQCWHDKIAGTVVMAKK